MERQRRFPDASSQAGESGRDRLAGATRNLVNLHRYLLDALGGGRRQTRDNVVLRALAIELQVVAPADAPRLQQLVGRRHLDLLLVASYLRAIDGRVHGTEQAIGARVPRRRPRSLPTAIRSAVTYFGSFSAMFLVSRRNVDFSGSIA